MRGKSATISREICAAARRIRKSSRRSNPPPIKCGRAKAPDRRKEPIMSVDAIAPAATKRAWYKSLTRQQWNVLAASNLGWLFDGFENYALILTAGPALRQLLDPSLHAQLPFYIGATIGINLLGWGIGGMFGGIAADYFGRKRVMMFAIVAYSVLTGVSAFSFNWISFAISRFLVGVAVGSEWATGSSMIAEL